MKFLVRQSLLATLLLLLQFALHAAADVVPDPAVVAAEQQRIKAVEIASSSTVAVFDSTGQGGGSGVVISPDGFALTNFHVVAPCGTAMKCGMPDGKIYDAVIVGIDPVGDVALIQLLGRDDFPVAELGDSDQVRVGDWVYAIGNPFLLANDFHPSVSYGFVSGVRRYQYPAGTLLEYTDCIQTDAAINPGNSGGPLFDADGKLVGINGRGSFEKRGRVNVGVGYAISINQIKRFLGHLKSGRIVDHATLGATVATEEDSRVVVDDILESSDAYRRGLRYGDEIVRFAGREITSANSLKNVLGVYPRGWTVPLTYRREGETFDTHVRLSGLHDQSQLFDLVQQEAKKPSKPHEDKPAEPKEEDAPADKPKLADLLKKKPKIPKAVSDRYEARRGFANYWYNQQKQEQLWSLYQGDHTEENGNYDWKISGTLASGQPVVIETTQEKATCRLPTGYTAASFTHDLETQLSPPGSGGLLLTLHLWQRFLDKGLRQFGEVSYLGQLPSGPGGQLEDCLVGIYAGIETRFLFTPGTGNLVGIEVFPDDNHDPCLLRFSEFAEVAGHMLATRWQVFHAGNLFADFQVDELIGRKNLFHSQSTTIINQESPLATSTSTRQTIRDAQRKVVKIYGAGGLREMEAYQSGMLVSPQGHVLTMLSYVLDTDDLVAILDDGRKLELEFLSSDLVRDIAVLKLKGEFDSLRYFDLQAAASVDTKAESGRRVMALSNLYGIATGNEAVSVLQGVVTAMAPLAARRGAFQANFRGEVYILDAFANNPGAAGGALVDWQGHLLGMLGKELRSEVTGTWLNYALPVQALSGPVEDLIAGRMLANADLPRLVPEQPLSTELLGLRLVPNVLSRTPPYIDSVRRDSVADRAGLRPDDLIVFLDQRPITSRQDFLERLAFHESEEQLSLSVLRDGTLLEFPLVVDSPEEQLE